ncbi:MAG: OmpH family outer membrane protein [Crocinitomicaceae bacterium]|jgi:outer membrane protein|nr:OmpH family outer membrane protein [Crocinitomicaceae bacterium]MDG1657460.1 OmpH family outer membrane protein [Crocinitomicaceae bacterium]|tara:strand:+ start:2150 stop:2659 length:510 start_codon:yes stop_codon:yes gene_type:complete
MKALILALTLILGTGFANSQKYAYIDSDFILNEMPEYAAAKEKLDKLADRWTKDIEQRYEILRQKKENFAREEVLLPAEEKKKRKEEIDKLETEAMQMQKVRFGVKGDYFNKRKELIKPIQDKIYDAMQIIASKRSYAMVFDKANQSNLIYADPKYDISKMVLKEVKKK